MAAIQLKRTVLPAVVGTLQLLCVAAPMRNCCRMMPANLQMHEQMSCGRLHGAWVTEVDSVRNRCTPRCSCCRRVPKGFKCTTPGNHQSLKTVLGLPKPHRCPVWLEQVLNDFVSHLSPDQRVLTVKGTLFTDNMCRQLGGVTGG